MFKRLSGLFLLAALSAFCLPLHSAPVDANALGFLPGNTAVENSAALQKALDLRGEIVVKKSGIYDVAREGRIHSDTFISFADGVMLRKNAAAKPFCHVLINSGAFTKTWNENIRVRGLHIIVNGVDVRSEIYGLRGHLSFFYARNVKVENFKCLDLQSVQFCIQACTFENFSLDGAEIRGLKDGVHLGRGRNFRISNCIFETYDDAVALNAHDYATSNPELGWLEDGVVENARDLDSAKTTGFFCRILAGAWIEWKEGMEVQHSDTVVSDGRLYRVQMKPDGGSRVSKTRPSHTAGARVYDGITWGLVQNDVPQTAGVRNVVFRNISLEKARVSFSVHFDSGKYSRSYYPDAPVPEQGPLFFENVRVRHGRAMPLLYVSTPLCYAQFNSCEIRANALRFIDKAGLGGRTRILMKGCVFDWRGGFTILENEASARSIEFFTRESRVKNTDSTANIEDAGGNAVVQSDLPGLK